MLLGPGGRAARAQTLAEDLTSPPTTPWAQPLAIPPVAQPVAPFAPSGPHQHYAQYPAQKYNVLTAKEREHSFHPELPDARIWGYDGLTPGPTLDARYGQPIMLRIRNELPAAHTGFGVPQLITHLHNFHTASESDGGPWGWTDPGGYTDHHYCMMRAGFTVMETDPVRGGIPMQHRDRWGGDKRESLSTLFFHYHRPEFTTAGIYKGLVGFFRIFDEMDSGDETTGWRLPSGPCDIPLAIADKQFDPDVISSSISLGPVSA
jgi:hypothetical protein